MPYITPSQRDKLDPAIDALGALLGTANEGELNYTLTRLVLAWFDDRQPRYADYNAALGVLSAMDKELYRRMVAAYEDKKVEENGDVYPT